jgi:CelD/BcsL family acetyltransferase involved in cellulose biosynthesis
VRYELVKIDDLGASEWKRWRAIQRETRQLSSPYFSPEFARCVAEVRDDARVCVIERDGVPSGFFPFQRKWLGFGAPIGGVISDYHGLVAPMDLACDTERMLERCRLLAWEFDHLPADQRAFACHHRAHAPSPAIDLSDGFDAYLDDLRGTGSSRLQQLRRKARKLEREVGPLRFAPAIEDPAVLRTVIDWKSQQCRRTGAPDFFMQLPWTRALVMRISETRTRSFQGMLSALWAGDELVSAHFGMCSERVLHWWFPVYNRAFGRYSPGALLLLHVIEHASARGLDLVDLGKGDDAYKATFANSQTLLAEGYATSRAFISRIRAARETTHRLLRSAAAPLRPAWRNMRRWIRLEPAPA